MQRTSTPLSYTEQEEALSAVAKALAHPVRVRILKLLAGQACCFTGELTGLIPMAQSTISQHLKALKEAGLIQGEISPPKVKYCINRERWEEARELFGEFFNLDGDGVCCS